MLLKEVFSFVFTKLWLLLLILLSVPNLVDPPNTHTHNHTHTHQIPTEITIYQNPTNLNWTNHPEVLISGRTLSIDLLLSYSRVRDSLLSNVKFWNFLNWWKLKSFEWNLIQPGLQIYSKITYYFCRLVQMKSWSRLFHPSDFKT